LVLTKIDEYEIMYSSNKFPPRIWLKGAGKFVGQLIFKADGTALPADAMVGTQSNIYYHLQDLANIVDMLRNEQPVYLLWSGPTSENGIKTTAEPVGEAEA
jgi:hypothetical protein